MAPFRTRARKTPLSSFLQLHDEKVTVEFSKEQHQALRSLLDSTGEPFAEDAIRVILMTLANPDNRHVFAMTEHARGLVSTFRDTLAVLARESLEQYRMETERQLVEFINQIHATEETQ